VFEKMKVSVCVRGGGREREREDESMGV
jgi:hypothetical protein